MMLHLNHTPKFLMGRGEWIGECLRMLSQANDDRPIDTTDLPPDWRFDWTRHAQTHHEHRTFTFE